MLTSRRHGGAAAGDLQAHHLGGGQKDAIDRIDKECREVDIAGRVALGERVIGVFSVRRRFDHGDMIPVGVHLLGQHHGQRRVHALAHFGMRDNRSHCVIRRYLDPDIEYRVIFACDKWRNLASTIAGTNGDANDDRTAGENTSGNERTPAPFTHCENPPCRTTLQVLLLHV